MAGITGTAGGSWRLNPGNQELHQFCHFLPAVLLSFISYASDTSLVVLRAVAQRHAKVHQQTMPTKHNTCLQRQIGTNLEALRC